MNRKQRRALDKKLKKAGKNLQERQFRHNIENLAQGGVTKLSETVANLSKCFKCNLQIDQSNNFHLDTWSISMFEGKLILLCDKCQ